MSLFFVAPGGSVERRWIEYAVLRDNVQHHLERGTPSPAFTNLHKVSEALGGGELSLPAAGLHAELEKAKALLDKPIADLAISQRTRSVVELQWPPPPGASTTLVREAGISNLLSGREKTCGDFFGVLLSELLRITASSPAGAVVKINDV